jgi:hypothetical protein
MRRGIESVGKRIRLRLWLKMETWKRLGGAVIGLQFR